MKILISGINFVKIQFIFYKLEHVVGGLLVDYFNFYIPQHPLDHHTNYRILECNDYSFRRGKTRLVGIFRIACRPRCTTSIDADS